MGRNRAMGDGRAAVLAVFGVWISLGSTLPVYAAQSALADDAMQRAAGAKRAASASLPAGAIVGPLILESAGDRLTVRAALPGIGDATLDLRPASVRAVGYRLLVQHGDGTATEVDPGSQQTYSGAVRGIPNSEVRAALLGEGLLAAVFLPDGATRWIQPLRDFQPDAPRGQHVIYGSAAATCGGSCASGPAEIINAGGGPATGSCGGPRCLAQLACDADWQYFDAHGGSVWETQSRILAIVHVANHQFIREVQIEYEVVATLVRASEPDPYSSFEPSVLLDQFRQEWNQNQTGISRSLAHLWTGRDLDGDELGDAFVGVVCTPGAYGLSEVLPAFACETDLFAHMTGHNFGATHCACPLSTMNATLTCANTFAESAGQSQAEIDAHADTRACLGPAPVAPANDLCEDATVITRNGAWLGLNADAGSDGASLCGSRGGGGRDIYWRITPPLSGTVSLDTNGSSFNTTLSVHSGCPCGPDNQIACDDDGGAETQSSLTFEAAGAQAYYIRVAGYGNAPAFGNVVLNVNAPALPNQSCDNATEIFAGQILTGSLFDAPSDGASTCDDEQGNPNAWYQFTAACGGVLTVETCGTNDFPAVDQGIDTVISIHSGCRGDEQNQIACNDNAESACTADEGLIRDSRVSATLSAGQNVKIRVTRAGMALGTGYTLLATFDSPGGAPIINEIDDASQSCATPYRGPEPLLRDPVCMAPATWSLVNGPPGMVIDPASGVVNWPSTVGGTHTIVIRATNGSGSDDEDWQLHIASIPPVVADVPNASAGCGAPYTGPPPSLTQPSCMSPVTWSLVGGPAGMTIDPASGVVSWASPTIGTRTIIVRAANPAGFDDESWLLQVSRAAPAVVDIRDATITQGMPYIGPMPALTSPTCMTAVTWSLQSGPPGMTIGSSSGIVSWLSPTVSGSPHTVRIRATNTAGFDEESWTVTVLSSEPCAGDVDGDRDVDLADLATLLSNFGAGGASREQGDLDGDQDVDLADLAELLSNFGISCP